MQRKVSFKDFKCALESNMIIDDPAARYVSGRDEKRSKSSTPVVEQVQTWITACKTGHGRKSSHCGDFIDTCLPDRCIDVFPDGEIKLSPQRLVMNPRLVETKGKKGRYIALSYCWGEEHHNPLQTTMENHKPHLNEIPFQSLALTLQDAVQTTRQLGVRYLWIDALCIIQDDHFDKDAQIGQMRAIFEGSFVTIVAASAINASKGFLTMPQPKPSQFRIPYFCPDGELGSLHCREGDQLPLRDQPINRRAWTLEERLLSHRKVIYLSDHVTWECDSVSLCDPGDISNMHEDDLRLPAQIRDGKIFKTPGWLEWAVHTEWVKNVAWYTKRELTRPSDKLRAIGGIADKYNVILNDRYLAGLWRSYLTAGLLWRRLVATKDEILFPRPQEYRAPTWSWASIDGEIDYDWPERKDGSLECTRLGHSESIASLVEIKIIDADIELARSDKPFGAVKSGFIEASGLTWVVRGDVRPSNHEEKGRILQISVQESFPNIITPRTIDCWPDTDEGLPQAEDELWLLALTGAAENINSGERSVCTEFIIKGILLARHAKFDFVRVGFFEFRNPDYEVLMSSFEKRTITLY